MLSAFIEKSMESVIRNSLSIIHNSNIKGNESVLINSSLFEDSITNNIVEHANVIVFLPRNLIAGVWLITCKLDEQHSTCYLISYMFPFK